MWCWWVYFITVIIIFKYSLALVCNIILPVSTLTSDSIFTWKFLQFLHFYPIFLPENKKLLWMFFLLNRFSDLELLVWGKLKYSKKPRKLKIMRMIITWIHIINFLKAFLHKFQLVHSWILCPKCKHTYIKVQNSNRIIYSVNSNSKT